jgi:prepilin-type N-terminal cleavage/methylation domain-containing protein
MNMGMYLKKGFTLIELMLVIAIIGILSGVLLTLINPIKIQQKTRDSRRLQDIDSLKGSIVVAVIEGEIDLVETTTACGIDGCDQTEGGIAVDGSGYIKFTVTGAGGLEEYITVLPIDPSENFSYIYASDGNDFEINYVYEHEDNIPKMATDGGNNDDMYEIGTALDIL